MLTCHPGIQGPFPKILPLLAGALREQGCHVVTEPWGRHHDHESLSAKLVGRLGDLVRIRKALRRDAYDMMLIHTTTEMVNYSRDLPAAWLARKRVRHVALQFHGSTPDLALDGGSALFKKASRWMLNAVDGVLVLSSDEQQQWQKFHPAGRFFTIANPYQARSHSAQDAALPPLNVPQGVPVLIYVGRLIEQKGIFDLLNALGQCNGEVPFHLLVAGAGSEEQAFRERMTSLGLQDKITLLGYLSGDRLWQAYQAADMFVFPSWSEGFPTVITEAMNAGLPIVTTHIRGAVDHLKEGVHATFVPPREPARLAAAVRRLLGDAPARQRMAEANRAKIRDFAPEVVARRYVEVLREIAAGESSAANRRP